MLGRQGKEDLVFSVIGYRVILRSALDTSDPVLEEKVGGEGECTVNDLIGALRMDTVQDWVQM